MIGHAQLGINVLVVGTTRQWEAKRGGERIGLVIIAIQRFVRFEFFAYEFGEFGVAEVFLHEFVQLVQVLVVGGLVEVFVVVLEPRVENRADAFEVGNAHVFGHFERGGQDFFVAFAQLFHDCDWVGEGAIGGEKCLHKVGVEFARFFVGQVFQFDFKQQI